MDPAKGFADRVDQRKVICLAYHKPLFVNTLRILSISLQFGLTLLVGRPMGLQRVFD